MSTTEEVGFMSVTEELIEQCAVAREYEKEMDALRDLLVEKQYEIADDSRRRRFQKVVRKLTALCWDLTEEKKEAEENLLQHLIDPESLKVINCKVIN